MVPEGELDQQAILLLYAAAPNLKSTLDLLVESYTAAATIKATYAQVKPAFDAVSPAIAPITLQLGTVSAGLRDIAAQAGALIGTDGAPGQLEQLTQLTGAMAQLSAQYGAFHAGLEAYTGGVSALAAQGGALSDGARQASGGVSDLSGGLAELSKGVGELDAETQKIPGRLDEEIDKILDGYGTSDAPPVSFASEKNADVESVQFVLRTEKIAVPAPPPAIATTAKSETFWDRFLDLFR
jgi:X-X-X-Leu-X-X-Gly heptad repeat protein